MYILNYNVHAVSLEVEDITEVIHFVRQMFQIDYGYKFGFEWLFNWLLSRSWYT